MLMDDGEVQSSAGADEPWRVGVGECAPLPDLSCDALPADQYEATLSEMCARVCREGRICYDALRPYPSMLFGLETAMAQLRREPPFDGASRFSQGEVGIPINGLVWMGALDEMYARVEEKLRAGFGCLKLKIGALDWADELEMIRSVRRRFSRDVLELRLDANGGFSVGEARDRLEELSALDIHSIEQPIKQGQWADLARLCDAGLLPIALDEELIGVNDVDTKARLLDSVRPQYIVLKPSLHGGMQGCREWVALAAERGIGSWLTSALETHVGLRSIGLLAAELYGDTPSMRQGLGTGELFVEPMPPVFSLPECGATLQTASGRCVLKGERLWLSERPVKL